MSLHQEINLPPPADRMVQELISGIRNCNAGMVKGVYLTGSIALNDFHPAKSDIDFVILCHQMPGAGLQEQLERVHRNLERKFKQPNFNGTYLTEESLDSQQGHRATTLHWHEGRMQIAPLEMAPVTLLELKTTALTVLGPPARDLPATLHPGDVQQFLYENINTYWKGWITKHSALQQRQLLLLLVPRLTEWVVLGMARQLYTLLTGKIASKTGAGFYCLDHLPPAYHLIVQQAINIRKDTAKHLLQVKPAYYVAPSLVRCRRTLDCASFILERFNEEFQSRKENTFQ
jgi:hypothetical protein